MPGLVVLIGEPGQPDLGEALDRCLAPLTFADYRTVRLVLPELGVALGRTGPARVASPQPGYAAHGQVAALLEGELPDAPALASRLGLEPHTPPATLLAELYARHGEQELEHLPGHWAVAVADRRRARVVIANDAFGVRPLFRLRGGDGTWIVASHPAALLAHPAAPHAVNPAAVADYVTYGQMWNNETLFQGIESLPTAAIAVFPLNPQRGGPVEMQARRYWFPAPAPQETLDEADLERVRQAFNASVHRMMAIGGPYSLALTGGMDARLILSAMIVAGVRPHTLVHSVPDSTDAMLSTELARRAGTTHHFFEVRGEDLADLLAPGAQLLGGLAAGMDVHPLRFLDQFTSFTHVMFTGIGSDILKRDHGAPSVIAGRDNLDTVAAEIRRYYNLGMDIETELPALLSPDWLHELRDQPVRSVRQTVEAISRQVPFEEIGAAIFIEQRPPKGDLVVRRELEARHPLMDRATMMAGWNLPTWARRQWLIHRYIVTRNAPALADVPVERSGEPLRYPFTAAERLRDELGRYWKRVRRRLGMPSRYVRRPSYRRAEWIRGPLRQVFYDVLLDPRTVARPYFRRETVERWLDEHMAGRDHTGKLAALLSLELTFRALVD